MADSIDQFIHRCAGFSATANALADDRKRIADELRSLSPDPADRLHACWRLYWTNSKFPTSILGEVLGCSTQSLPGKIGCGPARPCAECSETFEPRIRSESICKKCRKASNDARQEEDKRRWLEHDRKYPPPTAEQIRSRDAFVQSVLKHCREVLSEEAFAEVLNWYHCAYGWDDDL